MTWRQGGEGCWRVLFSGRVVQHDPAESLRKRRALQAWPWHLEQTPIPRKSRNPVSVETETFLRPLNCSYVFLMLLEDMYMLLISILLS